MEQIPKYILENNRILDEDGNIVNLEKDKEAVRSYFLDHVNRKMCFFHNLEEQLNYLTENEYYNKDFLDKYTFDEIKRIFDFVYSKKFRFESYMSAFKFYNDYAQKERSSEKQYLERYEDKIALLSLYYGKGDIEVALKLATSLIQQDFTPATPVILNTGKTKGGMRVSCYKMEIDDSLESISRTLENTMQLSKNGGGIGLNLSNLRARGETIKEVPNVCKGVVAVAKLFDNALRYADQAGARLGAGVVWLSAYHSDIEEFISSKKINADDDMRLKTLSIGVGLDGFILEKAKKDEDYYVFYPHTVYKEYGVPFADISAEMGKWYEKLVNNPNVRKRKVNARNLLQSIAFTLGESGYPFIAFLDNINRQKANDGLIKFSNLCVTGDTKLLTGDGYVTAKELYNYGKELDVVIDNRTKEFNKDDYGTSLVKSTKMYLTKRDADIFKITLKNGLEIKSTEWHKYYKKENDEIIKLPLAELKVGDKLLLQSGEGAFGKNNDVELAYLMGVITGDGCLWKAKGGKDAYFSRIALHQDKKEYSNKIERYIHNVIGKYGDSQYKHNANLKPAFKEKVQGDKTFLELSSGVLGVIFKNRFNFIKENKLQVPHYVLNGTKEVQCAYLSGLFQMDGYVSNSSIGLASISKELISGVTLMLLNLGINSSYYHKKRKTSMLPNSNRVLKEYKVKDIHVLTLQQEFFSNFVENIELKRGDIEKCNQLLESRKKGVYHLKESYTSEIVSIEYVGKEDVYDVTQPDYNSLIFNGIVTGNCSEILQPTTVTKYKPYHESDKDEIGLGVSCNLASLNIDNVMKNKSIKEAVENAMLIMNAVSDETDVKFVKEIERANRERHSVGLGVMGLHSYLARNYIAYGGEESIDFVDVFFNIINYYSLKYSNEIAKEKGVYLGFENSKYADGSYFDSRGEILPKHEKVKQLFEGIYIPTNEDWKQLKEDVMKYGLYNSERLAIAPKYSG